MIRKGFSLIELLTVITVFAILSGVLGTMFHTLLADVPRAQKAIESDARLQVLLKQLRTDVEAAKSLQQVKSDLPSQATSLVITLPSGTITYRLTDDTLLRTVKKPSAPTEQSYSHHLPNTIISWHVRRRDGLGYALEVTTSVKWLSGGRWVERLANSHIFFAGSALVPGGTDDVP